jgi:hypothetical protein
MYSASVRINDAKSGHYPVPFAAQLQKHGSAVIGITWLTEDPSVYSNERIGTKYPPAFAGQTR